jgi:hypothetical protein
VIGWLLPQGYQTRPTSQTQQEEQVPGYPFPADTGEAVINRVIAYFSIEFQGVTGSLIYQKL